MAATVYQAVRNDQYKLVRNWALDYDIATDSGRGISTEEFYEINQSRDPAKLKLDQKGGDLLARHLPLTPEQQANYAELSAKLDAILDSQKSCLGDGNGDGVVNDLDIAEYNRISTKWGGSSTYDFNHDGLTDAHDLQIIEDNMGLCP